MFELSAMFELSREIMGGLALAVFWIHVVLIAAAAGLDLRDLVGLRRRLRVRLWSATVERGHGPGGALARNVVEQVGRAKGDGKIHFSDADHRSECFGGVLVLGDGTRVTLDPGRAEVWPADAARRAAAAPSSAAQIAEAEVQAKRGKGWRREVQVDVGEGDQVWVAGRRVPGPGSAGGSRLEGLGEGPGEPILIAAIDPRRWLAGRCALIVGFIVAELAIAAGCTTVVLWPPLWDVVSMIGAAAALGFFLAVQPLGVSLNEGIRTPDRAYLRGRWG